MQLHLPETSCVTTKRNCHASYDIVMFYHEHASAALCTSVLFFVMFKILGNVEFQKYF